MVWLQQSARSLGGSGLGPVVDVDLLLVLREDVQLVPQLINNIYHFNRSIGRYICTIFLFSPKKKENNMNRGDFADQGIEFNVRVDILRGITSRQAPYKVQFNCF